MTGATSNSLRQHSTDPIPTIGGTTAGAVTRAVNWPEEAASSPRPICRRIARRLPKAARLCAAALDKDSQERWEANAAHGQHSTRQLARGRHQAGSYLQSPSRRTRLLERVQIGS